MLASFVYFLMFHGYCVAFKTVFTSNSYRVTRPGFLNSEHVSSTFLLAGKVIEDRPKKVCILGGGFAGVNVALTLASLARDSRSPQGFDKPFGAQKLNTNSIPAPELQVTLIDRKDRFVFLPLLYELCVNDATEDEVAPTFTSLFQDVSDVVSHKQGTVAGIDIKLKCVYYEAQDKDTGDIKMQREDYDALVICTGMQANLDTVPGAKENAVAFYTLEDCYKLQRQLERVLINAKHESSKGINVVVVGGGYSGVELALNVKAYLDQETRETACQVHVTLVQKSQDILPYSSEFNKNSSKERLQRANIKIMTGTSVKEVLTSSGQVSTNGIRSCLVVVDMGSFNNTDVSSIPADILLWTAGASPSKEGVLKSRLPRDARGRIKTSKTLQVKGVPSVFALGDCSKIDQGEGIPATAQVAMQQAPIVAWNVYSSLFNQQKPPSQREPLLSFRYLDLGEMMTLGSEDATINALGGLVQISGPSASILRRGLYSLRMPTNQQRVNAFRDYSVQKLTSTGK